MGDSETTELNDRSLDPNWVLNQDTITACLKEELTELRRPNDVEQQQLTIKLRDVEFQLEVERKTSAEYQEQVNVLEGELQAARESLQQQLTREHELKKQLEQAMQEIERIESVIEAAKFRELEQSQSAGIQEISRRLSVSERPKKAGTLSRRYQTGHATRLREVYQKLIGRLRARDVAANMFQRGALTLSELEKIQRSRTEGEASEMLVDILLSQRYDVYDCFLSALKETEQEDVYLWIVYKDHDINVKHTELIRRKYIFLVETMDPKFSGLLDRLLASNIINHTEKDDISIENGITHQNERLLSVLSRKSADQFERFIDALDRSGQKHVSDVLRVDGGNVSSVSVGAGGNEGAASSSSPPPRLREAPATAAVMGSVPKLTNYERTMSLGELCHYSLQEPSNILVSPSAVSDAANQPTFQCVVVGDPDVDKTLLLLSYVGSKVLGEDDYVPLVFHSCEKSVSIGNRTYRLLLKDTSGQENYDRLHAVNYVQTDVFLVCFSVIQPSTFDNIKTKWVPEIRQNCPQTPFILVGTQVDRRDDPTIVESLLKEHLKPTTAKDGEVLAKKLKAYKYLECSVVTRQGVEEVFTEAVEACRKGKRLSWGQQLIGKIRPK